jgi:catechol 2,3-dioxygenase-like lactoylglutathione lyase family enzyme
MGEAGGLIKGIGWIEAQVTDYQEMVRFYREVLGLSVYFEEDDKDFIQSRRVNQIRTSLSSALAMPQAGTYQPSRLRTSAPSSIPSKRRG